MNDTREPETEATEQPVSPEPPQPRPRLTRRTEDRMIAGVAGGLADSLGVDATVIRIAFVALALFGGSGLLLYLVCWLVIPERGQDEAPGESAIKRVEGVPQWVGLGLILLAAAILLDDVGLWSGQIVWAFALIAIGILLFRSGSEDADGIEAEPPAAAPAAEAVPTGTPRAPAARAAEPPRPRSRLGRLTLAVTLIALGGVALLDQVGWLAPRVSDYLAIALLLIGGGLLAGTWLGNARGLIAVGIVLLPLLWLTLAIDVAGVPLRGEFGERRWVPAAVEELQSPYQLGVGEGILDLRELPVDGVVTVEARVGVGQLEVLVPEDVAVDIDAAAGMGALELPSGDVGGFGVSDQRTFGATNAEDRLVLDLAVGIGAVTVTEVP